MATMRALVALLLLLLLTALALAPTAALEGVTTPQRPRRFLAGPENGSCNINPAICKLQGLPAGLECCGWTCVDTTRDGFNCGGCGKVCKFTEVCCGGECVNIVFDKSHCGSCRNKCPQGVLCIYGMCNYA